MKYDMTCRVFSMFFSKMLNQYYKDHFPTFDRKSAIKATKQEYKEMIKRTPSLSKDNYMAGNLKGAAYFFALSKHFSNMTPILMDEMVNDIMSGKVMMKMNKKAREKGTLFSKKEQDKMYKDSLRSQKSNDEMDWKFTYNKGNNEVYYSITKCGVCQLAKRENCLEYLPCMCKMDYPKYASKGAKLDRTKTLANGDDECNFHLIRMK